MPIKTDQKKIGTRSQKGFSLIEISIVLVILGLIMGGMMGPLGAQIESSRRNETTHHLTKALESMYGFALANGRLPCPDTSGDGAENRNGANQCISARGALPWATLSVSGDDAWGQPFIYRVTPTFADNATDPVCPPSNVIMSFSLCTAGNITVLDQVAGTAVANNIPAIIISRGKNWPNVPSANEAENTNNDAQFVDRPYNTVAGTEFDDIVTWIVPGVLFNRMVVAGRLP